MKLKWFACPVGHVRRYLLNVSIDLHDQRAFCGTRSGDFLEFSIPKGIFERQGPVDKKLPGAINQIVSCFNDLYVGSQDGTFARLDKRTMLTKGKVNYPNQGIMALTYSKSKIYSITDTSTVRSLQEDAPIDFNTIFMQGHFA